MIENLTLNLRNHLLIAMPQLGDPNFDHSVTLLCQQDEYGAFGVTINRPMDLTLGELMAQLEIEVQDPTISGRTVLSGGPVQAEQGFILHDGDRNWDSTLRITNDLALTSSKDILVNIAQGAGPANYVLVLGCAGWGPGQLEQELKENSWLTCPATSTILFELPFKDRWHGAAKTLGIDANLLGVSAGHS